MRHLIALLLTSVLLVPVAAEAHRCKPKAPAFGVAGLAEIEDNVAPIDDSHVYHEHEHRGGYAHDHWYGHSHYAQDPRWSFIARAWADLYVAPQVRLFANYDWDTRGHLEDGSVRGGASVDLHGTRSTATRLSLYGGGQRQLGGEHEWTGFAGGQAEHDLVSRFGLLGQAEYDLGRQVVAARAGATLRIF